MKRIARIFEYVTICDSDNWGIASVKDEQRTRQTNLNPGMAHLSAEVPIMLAILKEEGCV